MSIIRVDADIAEFDDDEVVAYVLDSPRLRARIETAISAVREGRVRDATLADWNRAMRDGLLVAG